MERVDRLVRHQRSAKRAGAREGARATRAWRWVFVVGLGGSVAARGNRHRPRCSNHDDFVDRGTSDAAFALRRTLHFDELPLATVRPVREDANASEAGPLVHRDRPAVEAGDGQRELLRARSGGGRTRALPQGSFLRGRVLSSRDGGQGRSRASRRVAVCSGRNRSACRPRLRPPRSRRLAPPDQATRPDRPGRTSSRRTRTGQGTASARSPRRPPGSST